MGVSTHVIPQKMDEPTLLVNVAHDDKTRGDVAGWLGLARNLSKKIGGRVVYADVDTIKEAYPEDYETTEYQLLLARYLEEGGYNMPSYVFGHSCGETLERIGHNPENVYEVTSYNETLSSRLLSEQELVSHHLTPEIIDEAGNEFDAKHPDIKKPIVSVMLVDPVNPAHQKSFAKRIVKIMSHYPEATIYLCASRRTEEEHYDQLSESIRVEINKQGLKDTIDLNGWKFDRTADYNPYKGLIARAKHFVVWGGSRSMVSEALFSGRTVYFYEYGSSSHSLQQKGCLKDFNEVATDSAPFSKEFEPINLTDRLADKIHQEQQKKDEDKCMIDPKQKGKDETRRRQAINAIHRNYHAAAHLPDTLKEDRKFVEHATRVRGFSLRYFPKFANDPAIVRDAILENKYVIRFLPDELRDSEDFIISLYQANIEIDLEDISERLRNDKRFLFGLIEKKYIKTHQLPSAMIRDREVAFDLLEFDTTFLNCCEDYKDDLEFAMAAVEKDHERFAYFSEDLHDNNALAVVAMKASPNNYRMLSERLQGNRDFAEMAVKHSSVNFCYTPPKFRDDKALLLRALNAKDTSNGGRAYAHASKRLRKDPEIIEHILRGHPYWYQYLEQETQYDPALVKQYLLAGWGETEDQRNACKYDPSKEKQSEDYQKAADVLTNRIRCVERDPLCHKSNRKTLLFIIEHFGRVVHDYLPRHLVSDKAAVIALSKSDPSLALNYLGREWYKDTDLVCAFVASPALRPEDISREIYRMNLETLEAVLVVRPDWSKHHIVQNSIKESDPAYVREQILTAWGETQADRDAVRFKKNDMSVEYRQARIQAQERILHFIMNTKTSGLEHPDTRDLLLEIIEEFGGPIIDYLPFSVCNNQETALHLGANHPHDLPKLLQREWFQDKDFMLQIAALPGVNPLNLGYDFGYYIPHDVLEAIVEIRPDWKENRDVRTALYGESHDSYEHNDLRKSEYESEFTNFKPHYKTDNSMMSAFTKAFTKAVNDNASPPKLNLSSDSVLEACSNLSAVSTLLSDADKFEKHASIMVSPRTKPVLSDGMVRGSNMPSLCLPWTQKADVPNDANERCYTQNMQDFLAADGYVDAHQFQAVQKAVLSQSQSIGASAGDFVIPTPNGLKKLEA